MKAKVITIAVGLAVAACNENLSTVTIRNEDPFFDQSCAQSLTIYANLSPESNYSLQSYNVNCEAHEKNKVLIGHKEDIINPDVGFILYDNHNKEESNREIVLVDYDNNGTVDSIRRLTDDLIEGTLFAYYRGPQYMEYKFEHASCIGLAEYVGLDRRNGCAVYSMTLLAAKKIKAGDNFGIPQTELGVVLTNYPEKIPILASLDSESTSYATLNLWFNTADNVYAGLKELPHDDPNKIGQQEPMFTQRYSADIATLLNISAPVVNCEE